MSYKNIVARRGRREGLSFVDDPEGTFIKVELTPAGNCTQVITLEDDDAVWLRRVLSSIT